jgi:hypothetical protein
MRLATLIAPCFGLALIATAGCDPFQEKQYFREGIGTDLSRPEIANATALLNQYIGYICKQAGLELVPDEPAASCSDRGFTREQWVQFVKAGMNDIDVRCDAYLAWLDNRRRSAEPLLRQIGDMGKATGSILDATGVGPHPLNIVGVAFGLAANTFTNVNSRLLLEVNQATVQSVVHKGQEEFRYRNDYTSTVNRSDAIYHLRSYLRLCMPFTIETDINTTVAIVKRVGPQSLENNPLIAAETDAPDVSEPSGSMPATAAPKAKAQDPGKSNQELAAKNRALPKRDETLKQIFKDYSPQAFPPSTVEKIYKVLCVPRAEWARVGEAVRKHIEIWEKTETVPITVDGLVDTQERDLLINKSDCPVANVSNYYERRRFKDGAETDVSDVIGLLNRLPDDKLPGRGLLPPNLRLKDPKTRARMAQVRRALAKDPVLAIKLLSLPDSMANQWTRDLADTLLRLRAPQWPNGPSAPPASMPTPPPVAPPPPAGAPSPSPVAPPR